MKSLSRFEMNSILSRFNLSLDSVPVAKKVVEIGRMSIDPDSLGLASFAFRSMEVKIKAAADGQFVLIILDYSYEHPSGSNGYEVRFHSRDNGENFDTM
jgi:hypothetical protein